MIIDANMYWFPEEVFEDKNLMEKFLGEIPVEYGIYGHVTEDEKTKLQQIVIEKPKGFQNLNFIQGEYRLERQLADMDKFGIDQAVLKVPCVHEWLSIDFCRLFNDRMAEFVKESGGRLHALAVVPPLHLPGSISELERCVHELGLTGVQLCAHYGDSYLDDPAFEPFFKKMNEYSLTAYVHHTPVPTEYGFLCSYNNLRRSYGRCVDQTTAIGHELFSGMFDKFPNVRLVHSMLGGGFFTFVDLMLPHAPKNTEQVSRFQSDNENIREHLKKNIFFEMSHAQPWGKKQLECAVEILGADHIVYGSSYPVRGEWFSQGADFVNDLDLTQEEKDLILYKNAVSLYGLK